MAGFVMIPLNLAFHEYFELGTFAIIGVVVFGMDIIIQMNTSFFKFGKIIETRAEIFRNYMN